jgi:hypothetical protein
MRRDMDLLRLLLLKLEALDEGAHSVMLYEYSELSIPEYTEDQVAYHLMLALEAGLIDQGGSGVMHGFMFKRLTWEGHDFADSVRDDKIWTSTKDGALKAGGYSMELLVDLAKGFIKKKLAEQTGITL